MPVRTQQILKAILDHSPENIVLMDRDYKVICYNERIRQTLFNYHNRYIEVGDDYREFVVKMAMPTFLTAFAKALEGEISEVELETVAAHLKLWFQYRVNPVYAPDGALLGVSLSAEDITERKLAQRELAESEAKFRALVEQSLVGVFILLDQRFVYANPAFEHMVATKAVELARSYKFADFIHDDDLAHVAESYKRIMQGLQDTDHLVLSAIRGDGEVRSFELNISRIWYNGKLALLGSVLDITERIDEEIRISEAVDRAQELERTQLGMELHDNVKQQLTATMLSLQFSLKAFPPQQQGRSLIENSVGYLQHAINELRQLSHRLAPAADEETHMLEKIADLVDRMNLKGDLQVDLEIEDYFGQFSPKLQLIIYRIIQEQFGNIIHYAKASKASIRIYKESTHLMIAIKDNGVGFDLSKKTNGIGLQNIRRRVQLRGGSVRIQTAPGAGFELIAALPLNESVALTK